MNTSSSLPTDPGSVQGDDFTQSVKKRTPYYRLTASTLKEDYKRGLITATGYLYYIVKVSRKDGWSFAIDDITTFCKEWGMKRGTFYDAKAKCVVLGLLKETIQGRVILQIEAPVIPITSDVESVGIPTGAENPTGVEISDECLKSQTGVRNLRQVSEISDSDPPESQSARDLPDSYRSLTDHLADLSHSPPSSPERENEVDQEELIKFVAGKNSNANNPRAYAKRCLKDDRDFWIEEFVKWQELRAGINIPPAPPPPSTNFEPESLEHRRDRFLKQWQIPVLKKGIRKAIASEPELGLKIIGDELRRIET